MRLTRSLLIAVAIIISQTAQSKAATFDSVSHIHGIKAVGANILMGTHEGLFEFVAQNNMKPIGKDPFDIMGLDSNGTTLFASGHPSANSKLPNPLGLLRSNDGGNTWKSVSLLGEVDFHFLEVSGSQIYGGNATDGSLVYSKNLGKSWKRIGEMKFTDIAILPGTQGVALAIENSKLFKTSNSFKSSIPVSFKSEITAVESVGKDLYIASKNQIFWSTDQAKSWKLFKRFKSDISDISVSSKLLAAIVAGEVLTIKVGA